MTGGAKAPPYDKEVRTIPKWYTTVQLHEDMKLAEATSAWQDELNVKYLEEPQEAVASEKEEEAGPGRPSTLKDLDEVCRLQEWMIQRLWMRIVDLEERVDHLEE